MKQAKCTVKTGCGLLVFSHHGGCSLFEYKNPLRYLHVWITGKIERHEQENRGPHRTSKVFFCIYHDPRPEGRREERGEPLREYDFHQPSLHTASG